MNANPLSVYEACARSRKSACSVELDHPLGAAASAARPRPPVYANAFRTDFFGGARTPIAQIAGVQVQAAVLMHREVNGVPDVAFADTVGERTANANSPRRWAEVPALVSSGPIAAREERPVRFPRPAGQSTRRARVDPHSCGRHGLPIEINDEVAAALGEPLKRRTAEA